MRWGEERVGEAGPRRRGGRVGARAFLGFDFPVMADAAVLRPRMSRATRSWSWRMRAPGHRRQPPSEARSRRRHAVGGARYEAGQVAVAKDGRAGCTLVISFSTMTLFTGIAPLYGSSLQYAGLAPLVWDWVVVSFTWLVGIAMADICSSFTEVGGYSHEIKHIMFVFHIKECRIEFLDVF